MNKMQMVNIYIEEELERCRSLHYRFAKKLSRIAVSPVFEILSFSERNGRKYYTEIWLEDGVRKTRYIGTEDNEEVQLIQEKHYLKKALDELDKHIESVKSINDAGRFECSNINEMLPRAYRLSPEHLRRLEGPSDEERWYAEAAAEKKALDEKYGIKFESDLKHTAKDGTRTRSKSEMSIANEFAERGKPYVYELPIFVSHFLIHPDFSFYSNKKGKVIYWEHAGKLGDDKYMKDYSERVDLYIRGGFVPGIDVIFTFDTISGNLDARMIKALLDEYQ